MNEGSGCVLSLGEFPFCFRRSDFFFSGAVLSECDMNPHHVYEVFFFFFENPSGRQCLSRESVWCPWTEAIETASWGENTRARVPWVSPAFTSKCCKGKSVFCCENANHTRWLGMSISFANTRNRTTPPPFSPFPLKSGPVVYHVSGAAGLTVILLRTQSNLFTQVSSFNISVSPSLITWWK